MEYSMKKRLIVIIMIIIFTTILLFFLRGNKALADSNMRVNDRKFFTSYVVKPGDTLWDIASEYITVEYSDRNEYIEEVMTSNRMVSSNIYDGQLIILPYYADQPIY